VNPRPVPRRARSTSRLRDQLVDAVIRSGRAVSETAAGFAVSWWMVRAAVTEACLLQLPDVEKLSHECWALKGEWDSNVRSRGQVPDGLD
jgi:hypothetical protein